MQRCGALTAALAMVFLSVAAPSRGEPVGFVTRNGTRFEINGRPYYYVGASYFNAMNLGADADSRAQLDADFATLRDMGITNVRLWASSEGPGGATQLTPTLQSSPGVYDETMFEGLDYALKSAAEND